MRNYPVANLDFLDIRANFNNGSSYIASGNMWKWCLYWFAPYGPKIVIVITCRLNLYQNFKRLYLWNIDIFNFDILCRVLIVFSKYCCLHTTATDRKSTRLNSSHA